MKTSSTNLNESNKDKSYAVDLEDESTKPPPLLFSKRLSVVIQIFIGFFAMYALRANISIAIVEMTSNKTIVTGNQTMYLPAEFNWNSHMKGLAFGCFAYGYLGIAFCSSITSKYGGVTTFSMTMFTVGLLTLFTPIILQTHFYIFLISRAIVGLFEALAYSSTAEIFARWTPPRERSSMVSYSISGVYIGTIVIYPICGYVAQKWGWPIVFYATGLLGCVTSTILLITTKNHPSKDKHMSIRERNYLLSECGNSIRRETKQPYKHIFKSKCFWALCATKFSYAVGFNLLVTCFPLYVKDMTNETTDKVGLISAIPNIACTFALPIIGKLLDYFQNKNFTTPTMIHKIAMSGSFLIQSLLFVIATRIADFTISMTCFVIIKMLLSFNFLEIHLVGLNMAPNHSSTILALTTFWYVIGMILTPSVIAYIVENHSMEEWNKCFLMTSCCMVISAIIFIIYGSSEPQSWSKSPQNVDKNNENELQIESEKCLKQ